MSDKSRKQQIEEMLAEDPKDSFLLYGLAMEYVREGRDDKAIEYLREILTITPDYVPAYQQAGQAWPRLDKADEARQVFQSGIQAAKRLGNEHAACEMEAFLNGLP